MPTLTTAHLDPAIFTHNLASLVARQPRVAAQLEAVHTTLHLEPVAGRDGSTTFRVDTGHGRATWLGHSSMPAVSSAALIGLFQAGAGNALLPSIGHGYEALRMLRHLGPQRAVFAWDSIADAAVLALRIHDFADAIRAGRLILAIGPDPAAALDQAFIDYPTHLPPEAILAAPDLTPEKLQRVQLAAETVAARQHGRLSALATAASERSGASDQGSRRVLVLSRVADPRTWRLARGLATAAAEASIDHALHIADTPANVHPAAAAQRIADLDPTDVILLNQWRHEYQDLIEPDVRCISWFTAARDGAPATSAGPVVAMGPEIAERVCGDRGAVLGPAACPELFKPVELERAVHDELDCDAAILLNTAPYDADAAELKWASHVTLWAAIVQAIGRRPRRYDLAGAERLLDQMCRSAKIVLDAVDVRRRLIHLISERVAPQVATVHLAHELRKAGIRLRVHGTGWDKVMDVNGVVAGPIPHAAGRNHIYNAASVVISLSNDAAEEEAILEALAAGATVIAHGFDPLPRHLAHTELLARIPTFNLPEHGASRIRAILNGPADPCTDARNLLCDKHLMSHRLHALMQFCTNVKRSV